MMTLFNKTENNKKYTSLLLLGVFVFSIFGTYPFLTMAEEKLAVISPINFCASFSNIKNTILTDITSKETIILEKRAEGDTLLHQAWANEDAERTLDRSNEDKQYKDLFVNLDTRANIDSEKQAVSTFKDKVNTASTLHRNSVDNTIREYQEGMQKTIIERNNAIDNLVSSYKTGILTAINKTEVQCGSNKSALTTVLTIRLSFKNELKNLEDSLNVDTKDADKFEVTMGTLGDVKENKLKVADSNFKKTVDTASIALKIILPDNTVNTTSANTTSANTTSATNPVTNATPTVLLNSNTKTETATVSTDTKISPESTDAAKSPLLKLKIK